jgi:hypothetical protein
VSVLSWLLFAACCAACFAIGWELRDWRQERADFRAEVARDAAWDRAHGVPEGDDG